MEINIRVPQASVFLKVQVYINKSMLEAFVIRQAQAQINKRVPQAFVFRRGTFVRIEFINHEKRGGDMCQLIL